MKIFNFSNRKKIFYILTVSLFALLTVDLVSAQPKEREYWPTNGWKTSTPEIVVFYKG